MFNDPRFQNLRGQVADRAIVSLGNFGKAQRGLGRKANADRDSLFRFRKRLRWHPVKRKCCNHGINPIHRVYEVSSVDEVNIIA